MNTNVHESVNFYDIIYSNLFGTYPLLLSKCCAQSLQLSRHRHLQVFADSKIRSFDARISTSLSGELVKFPFLGYKYCHYLSSARYYYYFHVRKSLLFCIACASHIYRMLENASNFVCFEFDFSLLFTFVALEVDEKALLEQYLQVMH